MRSFSILLASTLAACAPAKTLEGSVTPLLDLSYERAEAQASRTDVSVRFLRPQGEGEDTIL